jgi:UrcA family protein
MSTSIRAWAAGPRAKFGLLLLGSLAGIMAAGAAGAAILDSGDLPTVVVKYSKESLATDEGVNALYRRITNAARQVCPVEPTRDLKLQSQIDHCRNQAIARAIRQIDNSRLAALHSARSKNG